MRTFIANNYKIQNCNGMPLSPARVLNNLIHAASHGKHLENTNLLLNTMIPHVMNILIHAASHRKQLQNTKLHLNKILPRTFPENMTHVLVIPKNFKVLSSGSIP